MGWKKLKILKEKPDVPDQDSRRTKERNKPTGWKRKKGILEYRNEIVEAD